MIEFVAVRAIPEHLTLSRVDKTVWNTAWLTEFQEQGDEEITVLTYVTLQVGDIPPVRDWYVRVFDLTVEHETEGQIAVLAADGECRVCLESGPPVSEPNRVDLLFRVDNVDTTYQRLIEKGIKFWRGPTDERYGQRNAILFDPVGHKVEFFEFIDVEQRLRYRGL